MCRDVFGRRRIPRAPLKSPYPEDEALGTEGDLESILLGAGGYV